MPEESTTPDLVELTHRVVEAANRHDLETDMDFFAFDAVWAADGKVATATYTTDVDRARAAAERLAQERG